MVPSFTKGVRECGIVRRGDHRSPDKAIHSRAKRDVGASSFTKGVGECGIVRRGDHRSPNKAIRCRAKKDVGELFRTNGILFILATNGRPYAIILFCHPSVNCVDSSPQGAPKKPLLEERWHEVTEWWCLSPINKTAYIPYYINIQKERNDIYGI